MEDRQTMLRLVVWGLVVSVVVGQRGEVRRGQEVVQGYAQVTSFDAYTHMVVPKEAVLGQAALRREGEGADEKTLAEFFRRHPMFGVKDVSKELRFVREIQDPHIKGLRHRTYQQVVGGIDVFGVTLRAHYHGDDVTGVNGAFLHDLDVPLVPAVGEADARAAALEKAREVYPKETVVVEEARLVLYKLNRTQGRTDGEVVLAHMIEVRTPLGGVVERPVDELVFVDARSGHVVDHWDNVHSVLRRFAFQGVLQENALVFEEGQPIPTAPQDLADFVAASAAVYESFQNGFDVQSFDNLDSPLVGVINLVDQQQQICPVNAFFDGRSTTYYCPGLSRNDVVIHEFLHAYIARVGGGLIYRFQSGALNEALSDIYAEAIQILRSIPTAYPTRTDLSSCVDDLQNAASLQWIIGDEVTDFRNFGLVAGLRDALNPNCRSHPRINGDQFFYCGEADNGGVHSNSGVPNQGFSLLAVGGTLNGVQVQGIGIERAMHIHGRAMLVYNTEDMTFLQHARALQSACEDLVGQPLSSFTTPGAVLDTLIDTPTCGSVVNAMLAVNMFGPVCGVGGGDAPENAPTGSTAVPPATADLAFYAFYPPAGEGTGLADGAGAEADGDAAAGEEDTTTERRDDDGDRNAVTILAEGERRLSSGVACRYDGGATNKAAVVDGEFIDAFICYPPAGKAGDAVVVDVSIDNGATWSPQLTYSYYPRPAITSVLPMTGPAAGGTFVTVKGENFFEMQGCMPQELTDANGNAPDCLVCLFGNRNADWAVAAELVDATTMRCQVPPQASLLGSPNAVPFAISLNHQRFYYHNQVFHYALDVDNGNVEQVHFAATLSGDEEVPPSGSTGTGLATLVYDPKSNSLAWSVKHDLTDATMAHIHLAPVGENGEVVLDLGSPVTGSITGKAVIDEILEDEIVQSLTYINVHSDEFPDGAIRGQIHVSKVVTGDDGGFSIVAIVVIAVVGAFLVVAVSAIVYVKYRRDKKTIPQHAQPTYQRTDNHVYANLSSTNTMKAPLIQ